MSRSTRTSIASSLCALSLVAAGCGESRTHSAVDVQRAFARHGIRLDRAPVTPPRRYRDEISARTLRIPFLLEWNGYRLASLAEQKTGPANLVGDEASVFVAPDPVTARFYQRAFRPNVFDRIDNLLVYPHGRDGAVAAALADLR